MKEMCYFSDFKRHLQHYRPNFFTTSWEVYTRGFAGDAWATNESAMCYVNCSAYCGALCFAQV